MLIDFKVKNFRSLKEEQVFSMEASGGKSEHSEAPRQTDALPKGAGVLPVVAVYGANASGKTTLYRALQAMREMVIRSFALSDTPKSPIHQFVPFRLDSKCVNEPVELEVTWVTKGVRYRYGFATQDGRVVSERLHSWPKKKSKLVFERHLQHSDSSKFFFRCSEDIEGGRERAFFVAEQVHPQALFVSTARKLNHPAVDDVFEWFDSSLKLIDHTSSFPSRYTAKQFMGSGTGRAWTNNLMQWADLGIKELIVKEVKIDPVERWGELLKVIPESLRSDLHSDITISALHQGTQGELVAFDLEEDESTGTGRIFGLAGPLSDVLANGHTLVVDELSTSLHHWIVRRLIDLFQDSKSNPHNAQLIFTSHDPLLLDLTLLRRDQYYFVRKDSNGGSIFYSMAEMGGLRKEATQLHKHYLSGAFGAVPNLGPFEDFLTFASPEKKS